MAEPLPPLVISLGTRCFSLLFLFTFGRSALVSSSTNVEYTYVHAISALRLGIIVPVSICVSFCCPFPVIATLKSNLENH